MKKFVLALCLAGCVVGVQAQTLTISDETAGSPDTQAVSINYTAGGDLADFSVRIDYDPAELTPQTDAASNPNVIGCVADVPASHTGALTGCNNPFAGAIALSVTDQGSDTLLPTTSIGTITFDVAPGLDPGTISPIELSFLSATTDTGASIGSMTLNDGSITVSVPANESFFSASPVPGTTIDFGSAVVGTPTSPDETVTVSNLSTDTPFDITGAAGNFAVGSGSYSLTSPALSATVAASSSVDVNVNCTPLERGDNTGTYTITTDADNVTTADYPTVCTGLAPNVQVSSTSISLNGVVGGTPPTGSIDVLNPSGNFTSDANNAVVNTTTDVAEISATADVLADSTISVDEVDSLGYQCSTAAEGTFTEEFQIDYDDPISGGTASTATVTVTCQISDTAPIYNSAPTPGSLLALSAPFGTQSAPDGLDINNANTNIAGDDLVISSATASDPVFTVNEINSSFAPNVGPDGIDDVEVTCTPPGVGTINGTLTVQTNDGDQVYDLSCQGTGEVLTSNPPAGGTLNLGTVAPGTSTGEGLISFTNNSIGGSVQVDCSVTDAAGVFSVTPASPFSFTLDPGQTESAAFQCTPTDVSSFTADVSCTLPARGIAGLNYTVACAGRPLIIPTMSRWGLVVMSLVLLLVAGVAGRRMLA